jgi:hypothetical protein
MATVTGTIKFASDAVAVIGITFVPQETPQVLGVNVVTSQDVRLQTSTTGTFSTSLAEGRYTVMVDNGDEFEIDVPSGSSSYDIYTLFVVDGSEPSNNRSAGVGSPEGVYQGSPGDIYLDTANRVIYWKESGTGNTGWQAWLSA